MTIKQLFPNIVTTPESYIYSLQPLLDEQKIDVGKVFSKMLKDKEYELQISGINAPEEHRNTPYEFLTYYRSKSINYLYTIICKIIDSNNV